MQFFKSRSEREKARLERDIERTEKQIKTDDELSELEKRRRELDKKKARHDSRNFQDKVFDATVQLNQLEKKFVVRIVSEANAVKQERSKNQSSKRAEKRLKNAYLSLVMVKHAKKRLIEIQNDREWNLAMRELSGAIKTMNAISVGSDNLQKILFRARVEKMGWMEDNGSDGWFNEKTEQLVSKEELDSVMNCDPIDLLVADDIYDTLLENPSMSSINNCAERSIGVDSTFEDIAEMSKEANTETAPAKESVSVEEEFSDDELEESIRSWGKIC